MKKIERIFKNINALNDKSNNCIRDLGKIIKKSKTPLTCFLTAGVTENNKIFFTSSGRYFWCDIKEAEAIRDYLNDILSEEQNNEI